ncbi:hypothetical protein L1281_002356 [Neisseria sp. HSC-16F19]|nr:hypothetical protein [Neisseria sp. HSC-16F19]
MTEWINVNDRLPEPGSSYLVCVDYGSHSRRCIRQFAAVKDWRADSFDIGLGTVTHWQPIPEPPCDA